MHAQIVVDDLGHVFKPSRRREVVALSGVTLDIRHREFVAVKAIVDLGLDRSDLSVFKSGAFVDKVDEIRDLVKAEAIIAQTVLR